MAENTELVLAILRNRKRIELLRNFTLESGQEEIERRQRRRKEDGSVADPLDMSSNRNSMESLASPTTPHSRTSHQGGGGAAPQEDSTFAIGDDDDDDDDSDEDDTRPTPAQSDAQSRASSVASTNRTSGSQSVAQEALPTQLRGMSEKARGKMPAGAHSFSRQNSTTSLGSSSGNNGGSCGRGGGGSLGLSGPAGYFEPTAQWIDSWLPELPLHTLLTLTQQLTALLPRQALSSSAAAAAAGETGGDATSKKVLEKIRTTKLVGVEAGEPRVHSFEWSPLALGWYESLIWSFVFTAELATARGTAGIWNTTAIKLFRVVQNTAPPAGPSLTSPRGAVDAVGSNIVSRIGAINLRGAAESLGRGGGGGGGEGGGGSGDRREREQGRGGAAER